MLPAWEAAAPAADPFANLAQGGWVDDTGDEDAGDAAVGAPQSEGGAAADAGTPAADAGTNVRPDGRPRAPAQ